MIKQASPNDVEIISKIHATTWKTAYKSIVPQEYLDDLKDDFWVSAFKNWISNELLTVQLIFEDHTAVGCIAYGKSRDSKLEYWGEIISIYVLPDYFRKGYGKQLIEYALKDMKNLGYRNIFLWVLEENKKAKEFYEDIGFSCNNDKYFSEIMGKNLVDDRYIISL